MTPEFVPVDISLLNEGQFLDEVQGEFATAKDALLEHVATHKDRIRKAAAVVNVEIQIAYEDCDGTESYRICTSVKHKRPAPPARGSRVSRLVTEDGQLDLFVQPSGSRDEDPKQGRFAMTDGRGIDPESGKASEKHTLKMHATA